MWVSWKYLNIDPDENEAGAQPLPWDSVSPGWQLRSVTTKDELKDGKHVTFQFWAQPEAFVDWKDANDSPLIFPHMTPVVFKRRRLKSVFAIIWLLLFGRMRACMHAQGGILRVRLLGFKYRPRRLLPRLAHFTSRDEVVSCVFCFLPYTTASGLRSSPTHGMQ